METSRSRPLTTRVIDFGVSNTLLLYMDALRKHGRTPNVSRQVLRSYIKGGRGVNGLISAADTYLEACENRGTRQARALTEHGPNPSSDQNNALGVLLAAGFVGLGFLEAAAVKVLGPGPVERFREQTVIGEADWVGSSEPPKVEVINKFHISVEVQANSSSGGARANARADARSTAKSDGAPSEAWDRYEFYKEKADNERDKDKKRHYKNLAEKQLSDIIGTGA